MLFSHNHIWLVKDVNTAKLGISHYAQSTLGDIIFLSLPDIGDIITVGSKFAEVESMKTVSELISPVNGTVTAINTDLLDAPYIINSKPYDSWLMILLLSGSPDNLLTEYEYNDYLITHKLIHDDKSL